MAQRKVQPVPDVTRLDPSQLRDAQREEINERFSRTVKRIRERNADRNPDQILRDVTEVVEEVRQERYERERRAQGGR